MGKANSRSWRRAVAGVWDNLWFVPLLYVLVALALSVGLVRWDEADPMVLARSISSSSASAALRVLSSGMLAFTGFVTVVLGDERTLEDDPVPGKKRPPLVEQGTLLNDAVSPAIPQSQPAGRRPGSPAAPARCLWPPR